MALQIIWTPDAVLQLYDILSYWEQRNGSLTYSRKLYEMINNALDVLAKYPESGKSTEKQLVRVKTIKEYYLFYSYNSEYLSVIGICDMRRDPEFVDTLIT